jgi:hypothetical protein
MILAYLMYFGIQEVVEVFIETREVNMEMLMIFDHCPEGGYEADRLWILFSFISQVPFYPTTQFRVFSVSQLAVRDRKVPFFKLFLHNGADANTFCRTGFSLLAAPLRIMSMNNHLEIVNILLAYGADPTIAECTITVSWISRVLLLWY